VYRDATLRSLVGLRNSGLFNSLAVHLVAVRVAHETEAEEDVDQEHGINNERDDLSDLRDAFRRGLDLFDTSWLLVPLGFQRGVVI